MSELDIHYIQKKIHPIVKGYAPLFIRLLFLATISSFLSIASFQQAAGQTCSLPKPANRHLSNVKSCEATLTWNAVPGAAWYKVKFKVEGASVWSNKINVALNTSYTFTGLNASTEYRFAVAAFCSNNKNSGFKSKHGTTSACTIPTVTSVQPGLNSISISWDGCPSSVNQVRFRKVSDPQWTFVSTGSVESVTINNLTPTTPYLFQVSACADTSGMWSSIDTFYVPKPPNILLIILDDARYDSYSCNGGPSFFHSTNIDRIANEGVNFKNNFCVESYCVPSRGSIVTGLYPHKHGAVNNSSNIYSYLPTTATILKDAGYYSGWIGKYHMAVKPQPGYDYWFATVVNTGTDEYHNMKYNYNGISKTVYGHDTDILTDTTLAFLDRNSTKNFFVTLAYHAPHYPYIPQDEFDGMFSSDQMPVPANTEHYSQNYPSFLYDLSPHYYIAPSDVAGQYEKYYELLAGADAGIGAVLQKLTDLDILNNTLIIFTSDNGLMLGEHGLFYKLFAYDPSSRVPLFIRYPSWFSDSTIITDQMTLNIDIAPTILDAAGIHGNYSFDGVSVKDLADGSLTRTAMYYEYSHISGIPKMPYMRSVRTLDSKLVEYGCDQITEEFFDLTHDAGENNNRINDTSYAATIHALKNQLNDFHTQLQDTLDDVVRSCFLQNITLRDQNLPGIDEENVPAVEDNISLFPIPASDQVTIEFSTREEASDAIAIISSTVGTMEQHNTINVTRGINAINIELNKELANGFYLFTLITNNVRIVKPFVIEK